MSPFAPTRETAGTRVVIVGGGVTGLATALRLHELAAKHSRRLELRLFEAAPRLGGHVQTHREGPWLLESGPDSLVTQKTSGLGLCRRLGLNDELIVPDPSGGGTQLWHRGRLWALPSDFVLMAPTRLAPVLGSGLFSPAGKLRLLAEGRVRPRAAEGEDESLSHFVSRRFGTEALERIAEPIVAGLYTGDADRLSARRTLPRLFELEARFGSVARGLRNSQSGSKPGQPGMVTLQGGLGTLIDGLARALPDDAVATGTPISTLTPDPVPRGWILEEPGRRIRADAVILACPAHVSARLVNGFDRQLGNELRDLDYASCATLNLVYAGNAPAQSLQGFGFFVPRRAKLPILACSYASLKFSGRAPGDQILLRVFVGGVRQGELLERNDDELVELAHRALRPLLRLGSRPTWSTVFRHPHSMPQFTVGDHRRVERVLARCEAHPGLVLSGSAIGAYGLPDCIRSGERAAETAWSHLESQVGELELAGPSG